MQLVCEFQTKRAESLPDNIVLVGNDKQNVTLTEIRCFRNCMDFIFTEELGNRGLQPFLFPVHPGETFCPVGLDKFSESVDFFAGELFRCAFGYDTADASSGCERILENGKTGIFNGF